MSALKLKEQQKVDEILQLNFDEKVLKESGLVSSNVQDCIIQEEEAGIASDEQP